MLEVARVREREGGMECEKGRKGERKKERGKRFMVRIEGRWEEIEKGYNNIVKGIF